MAQTYNPQWKKMMDVDTALMRRMARDNFTPSHTGGGCMAWEHATDDGGHIWITDESGVTLGSWSERKQSTWIVGRYSSEGEFVTVTHVNLVQALQFADTLPAPKKNEQTIMPMPKM